MLQTKISTVEELRALIAKTEPSDPSHPLPNCPAEVVEKFVSELCMDGGIAGCAFYGEIQQYLTFEEFVALFDNMGVSLKMFADHKNFRCINKVCQQWGGYICNPSICAK